MGCISANGDKILYKNKPTESREKKTVKTLNSIAWNHKNLWNYLIYARNLAFPLVSLKKAPFYPTIFFCFFSDIFLLSKDYFYYIAN